MTRRIFWLLIPAAFLAALAGVFVGRVVFPASSNAGVDLHAVLHDKLTLDADQERRLEVLETDFAARRRALENQLRTDNRRLAAAMQVEHRNGPEVSAAIDASHVTMGRLQKETVAHVFTWCRTRPPDIMPLAEMITFGILLAVSRFDSSTSRTYVALSHTSRHVPSSSR